MTRRSTRFDRGAQFESSFDRELPGAGASIPSGADQPHVPVERVPVRRGRGVWLWLWGVVALSAILVVSYLLAALGPVASTVGLVLAIVPFVGVVMAVLWVDRWEPEPKSLIVFALAWGAIPSIVIALLVDVGLAFIVPPSPLEDLMSAIVQAPIVEELAKGAGLLLIAIMGRRALDGPVDGVVYGALVGAGFALTENVQYFAVSLIEGGAAQLGWTFVARGILSPFAHAMFTAVIGYALGRAARRAESFGGLMRLWMIGVIGAIALHAFWNASSVLAGGERFWALYIGAQVPLFVGFMLALAWMRREEERLTIKRLGEYAGAGWFTEAEARMLGTLDGRRAATAWAKGLPGNREKLMRRFIREALALAATRQRAMSGRDPHAAAHERAWLQRLAQTRVAILS